MKTSKVKSVQGNGDFKDMKVFEVVFENGDAGNNYAKVNANFKLEKSTNMKSVAMAKNQLLNLLVKLVPLRNHLAVVDRIKNHHKTKQKSLVRLL